MRLPHRLAAGVAVGVLGLAGLTACSDDGGGVTDNKSADTDDDGDVSAAGGPGAGQDDAR